MTSLLLVLGIYLLLQRSNQSKNVLLRQRMLKVLGPYGQKAHYQSMESYLRQLIQLYPLHVTKLNELLSAYQQFEFAERHEQLQQCRKLLHQLAKHSSTAD